MRILVTGTSGHVGGAIARRLVERGHEVAGLSRRGAGIAGLCGDYPIDLGSVGAADAVRGEIAPCAAMVHAAADLSKSLLSPTLPLVNCLGTEQLLEVAESWNTMTFIFISGVNVIGTPRHRPIDETHPARPQTAYHASKLFGEHLTRLAGHAEHRTVVLRLSAPVGPHMPQNRILPTFVAAAATGRPLRLAGEGTRRQNYVDEGDFASAVEACLSRDACGLYHIGGARSYSNLELARLCIDVLASDAAIEFAGTPDPEEGLDWTPDLTRAKDALGYAPQVPLEQTIRALAAAMTTRQRSS
jgi:nucleoside-diphosphate-sugar epimerase